MSKTVKIAMQVATLAILLFSALAGLGYWAIDVSVAQQVGPLKAKVATLEQQGAALVAIQKDVSNLKTSVTAIETDMKWIKEALEKLQQQKSNQSE